MAYRENTYGATGAEAITPSDTAALSPVPRSLWIGGAGDVALVFPDGTSATFAGVGAGTVLPVQPLRVMSTGTTATDIVGML